MNQHPDADGLRRLAERLRAMRVSSDTELTELLDEAAEMLDECAQRIAELADQLAGRSATEAHPDARR